MSECPCVTYYIFHTESEHYGDEIENRWCSDCDRYQLTNRNDECLECGAST